jgi:hypothetical protein
MSDETFNPFNMNMPWDVDPSKEKTPAETPVEPKDETEQPPEDKPDEQKQDIFTALEEKLKLPIGSTKEGIEETKQMVRKIQAKTQIFETKGTALLAQEKLGKLTPEQHFAECARIRAQANRLYDISSNLMDKLNDQVESSLDMSDKMWSAVSSMISSVGQSLERLLKVTQELRKEEDLLTMEIKNIEDAKKLTNDDGTMDATPDDMNKLILFFQENEKKEAEQKQIEHKDEEDE